MNFLEIVKETARLSGTVDPRSVETVDAPGRIGLIAALVRTAWTQIQAETRAWRFLTVELPDTAELNVGESALTHQSLNLTGPPPEPVPNTVYPPPWSDWIIGEASGAAPWTIWRKTPETGATLRADELRLLPVPYPAFRESYQRGVSVAEEGRPQAIAVDTQDRLVFWPKPTEDYLLSGTYRRAPQMLTDDDDEPIVADEFHHLLVWAGKLLLDHHDEAGNAVLLSDMNLPMTFQASMGALRSRYLNRGLSIAARPIGGTNPGGLGTSISITNIASSRSSVSFFE